MRATMCSSSRCTATRTGSIRISWVRGTSAASAAALGSRSNHPLPRGADSGHWLAALEHACDQVTAFAPQTLVVSLGVDAFRDDPLGGLQVDEAGFSALGARLAQLRLPTVFLLEGGYAVDALGDNVVRVLKNFIE